MTFMQYESIMQYILELCLSCVGLKTARETKAQGLRPARRRRGQALSARSALVSAESRQGCCGWRWRSRRALTLPEPRIRRPSRPPLLTTTRDVVSAFC